MIRARQMIVCIAGLLLIVMTAMANAKGIAPIKLEISSAGAASVRGTIEPDHIVRYSLTPSQDQTNMKVQVRSSNGEVIFTVWDTGSQAALAFPRRADTCQQITDNMLSKDKNQPCFIWEGRVLPCKYFITIETSGKLQSSYVLEVQLKND